MLPLLTLILCRPSCQDESGISVVPQADATAARLTSEEIDVRMARAREGFSARDDAPARPDRSGGPRWEVELQWPGAAVRCSHPLPTSGSPELNRLVDEGRRESFVRLEGQFREFLRWQEEEGRPWERLWCEEFWDVSIAAEKLVSLKGQVAEYSGGAHGNFWFRTRNVWMGPDGARVLALRDLFHPDSRWQMALSCRVLAELRVAEAQWVVAGEIEFADESLLDDWTLTEKEIVFDFAPYDVSSYASGAFQVRLEYEELAGLLDPEGPVGPFLR